MSVESQTQSLRSPVEKEGGQVQAIFGVKMILFSSEEDKESFIHFLIIPFNLSFMSLHCGFCLPFPGKQNSVFNIAPP